MPTLTTHVGKDSAGMKLVGFPNNDLDDESVRGGLMIKENNSQGFKIATPGDGVNLANRMKHQRGNVQKGSIQTLKAQMEVGVVVDDKK